MADGEYLDRLLEEAEQERLNNPVPKGYTCWVDYWSKNLDKAPVFYRRQEDHAWFHSDKERNKHFAGLWVAVAEKQVICATPSFDQALQICKEKGIESPYIKQCRVEDPNTAYFGL